MHVGWPYKSICDFKRSVTVCVMCYNKIEIHDQGFDCIWQVRFILSRVAEAQFNTRMTAITPLLDAFLYYASQRHVLIFSAQGII